MRRLKMHRRPLTDRRGFTLVELLVVISIIAILLTMTLLAVNFNNESDRVKKGARQVQSFLLGARDRAIQSGEEVGVRFYVGQPPDGADPLTTQIIARQVLGMAYIGRSGTWPPADGTQEQLTAWLETTDNNGDNDQTDPGEATLSTTSSAWWSLKRRGWLVDGLRVRIPNSSNGSWYQVDTSLIDVSAPPPTPPNEVTLRLITPYDKPVTGRIRTTYSIELPWSMLPEEPSILPEDVVIDLDYSRVPDAWRPVLPADLYREFVDVIFSPQGTVTGDAGAAGLLHLYVCDAEDSRFLKEQTAEVLGMGSLAVINAALINPNREVLIIPMDWVNQPWTGGDDYTVKPRRVVTIVPQTGAVAVHDVNANVDPELFPGPTPGVDANGDGWADDPFKFAESGETSN